MIYQTEKLLREQGEKITGSEKEAVEARLADLKSVKDGSDVEAIKTAVEGLVTASQGFAQKLYEASANESGGGDGGRASAGRPRPTTKRSSTPRSSTTTSMWRIGRRQQGDIGVEPRRRRIGYREMAEVHRVEGASVKDPDHGDAITPQATSNLRPRGLAIATSRRSNAIQGSPCARPLAMRSIRPHSMAMASQQLAS